jgi:hypothetical protein
MLLLLALSAPASAGADLTRDVALPPGASLAIQNTCGEISVIGWDLDRVRVEAGLEDRVRDVSLEVIGGEAQIAVHAPERGAERCAWLRVRVPAGASLVIEAQGADVQVAQLRGALAARTVSGDVIAVGPLASVEIETADGDVELDLGPSSQVAVQTLSGAVQIAGGAGLRVEARSVDGALSAASPEADRVSLLASGAGEVSYRGGLQPGGRLALESHTGDALAWLPSTLSASVRLESFTGGLHSALGDAEVNQGWLGAGRSLVTELGAADGSVRLTSFSGDVSLERR